MRASFPIEGMSGNTIRDLLKSDPEARGFYPIGGSRMWHGGLHIQTAGWESHPVVAIAEGRVVAYRITDDYLKFEDQEYSNSFVLVEHEYLAPYDDGDGNPRVRFKFYSLYMHLLPASKYTDEMKKRLPTVLALKRVGEKNKDKAHAIALRSQPGGGVVVAAIQKGERVVSTRLQTRKVTIVPPSATPWVDVPVAASSEKKVNYCDTGGESHEGWVKKSKLKKVEDQFPPDPLVPDDAAGTIVQTRNAETIWRVEGDENGVFAVGLQGRTGPGTGANTRVFRHGTAIEYEIAEADYPWVRVLTPPPDAGGEYTPTDEYVCLNDANLTFEPTITYWDEFKKVRGLVFPRSLFVKEGQVIGYPGKYYGVSQVHVEVFTPDDFPSLQTEGAKIATPYLQTARIEAPAGKTFSATATGGPEQPLAEQLIVDAIIDDGTKRDLIRDKSGTKLRIWNGSALIWVKEADLTRHSPLAWPGFHAIDSGGDGASVTDAFYDKGEGGEFFADVYDIVDENKDKSWSAQEMKDASSDDKKYASLKGLVCRYPSEWQTDDGMAKWEKLGLYIDDADRLKKTKEFIKGLTWWDQVAPKAPGFPVEPTVWHFHPVAFVENYWLLPEEEVSFFVKEADGRREVYRGPIPAPAPVADDLGSGGIFYQTVDNSEVRLGFKQASPIGGIAYIGLANAAKAESPSLYRILHKPEYASYINGIPLTERDKCVWTGITDNEGNMQALNQWDNAFLSVGPFQQTAGVTRIKVGTMTHWLDVRGELQGAIDSIGRSAPELIQKYFGKHGLAAVDVKLEFGVPKGRFFLRGRPFVLGDKEEFRRFAWAYRFYMALKDVDFCREFLRQGFPRLARVMSLTRQISWNFQPPKPTGAPPAAPAPPLVLKTASFSVGTTFGSDLALALILDAHINLPACVESANGNSIWAQAIHDYLEEKNLEALSADNATEWRLIKKIVANRAATKMSDPQLRAANILKYAKTTDLDAMAAEFGFATEDGNKNRKKLVEEVGGLDIHWPPTAPNTAYGNVVNVGHVDVLGCVRV